MTKAANLIVSISEQMLYVNDDRGQQIKQFPISTSKYGVGSENGSFKTPLGKHCIKEKIGGGAPFREVFVGRQPMGVLDEMIRDNKPLPEDIITSRILWLGGLEPGLNHGGDVDSYGRYIYIHGTDEEDQIGTPASHGCIRMRNNDVIELYDLVDIDCVVEIKE